MNIAISNEQFPILKDFLKIVVRQLQEDVKNYDGPGDESCKRFLEDQTKKMEFAIYLLYYVQIEFDRQLKEL